jgi:transposase InsO family protein
LRVARELDRVAELRSYPCMIVSDNGTELTSNAILAWQQERGVEWHYIAPGKPMQNGFVESFMYGRPLLCKVFDEERAALVGCVHVCGLLVRPVLMTAGPDGVRGSTPHQRVALERA